MRRGWRRSKACLMLYYFLSTSQRPVLLFNYQKPRTRSLAIMLRDLWFEIKSKLGTYLSRAFLTLY